MRIRRNQWLTFMLAASIPVFAAASVHAQGTTATAAVDGQSTGSSAATAAYNLEPGDQLIYKTQGKVSMEGMGQAAGQQEDIDLTTSLTVLQKTGENLTVYAALAAAEETTAGKTLVPGPRFTFEMPVTGARDQEEFEKAGLSGAAFPTFSVETLFAELPGEGKSTVSVALPITNSPANGEAVTTREGANLKTVTSVNMETTPVLTRTVNYSTAKQVTESIETSVSLKLTARNMPVEISITDRTELQSVTKLAPNALEKLKSDIESAVPIAAKLRTLSMSSPDAMKAVLDQVNTYLATYPEGEFALVFSTLQEQLTQVTARTANWEKIKKGEVAPDFTATTIDNKTIKLSDYRGKIVLLDFWATWCGPCIAELPNVKKLYAENKDKGFEIIGISADESIEDLQKLVEQENLQWPQIFDGDDADTSIQKIYGVMKYPTTILLDKEGKIQEIDLRGEALDKAVTELLEAK